ncbi:molybdate ABC transporter substrate-binding protein [Desulfoluna limicola]|uniref:Molybdate ABC transporter substrate-binding protein n=1 Tax=Desulfoluna limicola TaxID=2810562 RepID=A0ABN6F1T8_9BACT|nr:molybdate ABC transporter substrate-binding protein [Desulfoluna limicola]BCS95969.1 molybdate ABC transporter substrate-binding protein [Desulfoluna limicola]
MCNRLFKISLLLFIIAGCNAAAADEITVFAAASTTNAVTEVAELYSTLNSVTVKTSFASSSTLAKQIKNGAPADVYISANVTWMDYLAAGKAIAPGSRVQLLANRLVLISSEGSGFPVVIDGELDLTALLKGGYLAMGDASHVPAGMYAEKALQSLGQWEGVKDRVSNSKDVRAALLLVERGETPFGIVYATDVKISKKVQVAGGFPASSHPPITYPAAITKDGDRPAVRAFMDFLSGEQAGNIFHKYGFERL